MTIKVYKLRDKSTGLFAIGGTTHKFNKNGKIWKTKGHLKNYLHQFKRTTNREINILIENMQNWEIVEYTLTENETTDLFTFISDGDHSVEFDLLTTLGGYKN